MTHDEMIEAVAERLDHKLNYLVERDTLACDLTKAELLDLARAAIRVIAPAVLEEAAREADQQAAHAKRLAMEDQMTDTRVVTLMASERLATAIRALKTRYEQ